MRVTGGRLVVRSPYFSRDRACPTYLFFFFLLLLLLFLFFNLLRQGASLYVGAQAPPIFLLKKTLAT